MKNNITNGEVFAKDGQIYKADGKTFAMIPYYDKDNKEHNANQELIAEAFNVTNEIGKTPRQLADENKLLLDACIEAKRCLQERIRIQYSEVGGADDETCKRLAEVDIKEFLLFNAIENATK